MDSVASLPPQVNGNVQGYLDVKIKQLEWIQCTATAINIKILWWGQQGAVDVFKLNSDNDKILQTYQIKTSYKLFSAYLLNSEPLTLSVVDSKSGKTLGTCKIVNLSMILNETPYESSYPVINVLGKTIGKLHMSFRLCMVPLKPYASHNNGNNDKQRENRVKSKEVRSLDRTDKSDKRKEVFGSSLVDLRDLRIDNDSKSESNLVSNKFLEQVFQHGKELRKNLIEDILDNDPSNKKVYQFESMDERFRVDSERDSKKSNSQLFNFLTGVDLSENEEKEIIENLRNDSPPSSIIAAASDLCYGPDHPNTKRRIVKSDSSSNKDSDVSNKHSDVSNDNDSDVSKLNPSDSESTSKSVHSDISLLKIADSLKIYIYSLRLNNAGWKKVTSAIPLQTLRLPTFYVEYSIPDILSEKSTQPTSKINSGRPNFPDVRFCSKIVSDKCDKDIPFKKYSLHNVSNLHVINLNDVSIEFRIHSRSVNRKGSSQIGSAKCTLGELTQATNFTNSQEVVIIDNTKPLVLGSIKIRVLLGCDRLHFGKDFIDAVSYSKKNKKLTHSDSMIKFCEGKTVEDTKSVDKELESKKENRKPTDSKKHVTENKVEHVHSRKIKEHKPLELLQGLVHIPQVILDTDITNGSVYLMCRSFWREDSTVSKLCHHSQRALFNFRELIPILYNEDFLIRTKNNFLVVEVWHTSNETNVLLGISKLPLHNFFVAYRDKEIAAHLVKRKFPVIGFDGWESIIDPLTGINYGKVQAFIAVGTESQIQRIESIRSDEAFTTLTKELIPSRIRLENQSLQLRKPLVDANEKDTHRSSSVSQEKVTRYITSSSQTELDGSQIELLQENLLSARSQTVSDKEVQCSVAVSRATQTNISLIDSLQSSQIEKVNLKMSNSESEVQDKKETDCKELIGDSNDVKRDLFESFIECLTARLPSQIDVPKSVNFETSKMSKTVDLSSEINIEEDKSVPIKENMEVNLPTRPTSLEGTDTRNSSPQIRNTMELLESLQSALSSVAPLPNLCFKLGNEPSKGNENFLTDDPVEIPPKSPVESTLKNEDNNYQRLFKIHVVIENAMHLSIRRRRPKHKSKYTKRCEPQAPSTYVSFEPIQDKVLYTRVVPKSFAPCWNDHFETYIPVNFLFDDQKRLIFKVWNKTSSDSNAPNPLIDTVIGFAALDLTVLPVGLPSIQGWFNIMDFSGRCNGQIKIDVAPLENLSSVIASSSTKVPVSNQKLSSILDGPSTSLLSNALKRKFTELDEITERLKQRLLNVTHDDSDDLKDEFVVEFEHDLNTKCDESDESDFFNSQKSSVNKNIEQASELLEKSIGIQESLNNNTDKLIVSDSTTNNKSIAEIITDSSNNGQLENSTNQDGNIAHFSLDLQRNRLNLDSLFQKLDMHTLVFNKSILRSKNIQDSSEPKTNVNTDSQPVISEDMSGDTSMCVSSLDQKTDDSEHVMDSDCVNNIVEDLRYRSELFWLRQAPEGAGNASDENIIIKN